MAKKSSLSDITRDSGLRRLQPRLRMIRNGGRSVNEVRAERAAAVALKTQDHAHDCVREPGHICDVKSQVVNKKKEKWENVDRGAKNIVVDVFIHLVNENAQLPNELIAPGIKRRKQPEMRQMSYGVRAMDFGEPTEGIHIVARNGAFMTAEVPLSLLDKLRACDQVSAIEVGQELKVAPPVLTARPKEGSAKPRPRFNTRFRHDQGKNALIGIIDIGGFDFSHPEFIGSDGGTRFVEIWDQASGTRAPPKLFEYGALIKKAHMNRAIESEAEQGLPAYELEPQSLRMRSSHATHVASIAAGNHGICPRADIAGVSLALPSEDMDPRLSFYDSTRLAHAVDYLLDLGERLSKPVSINISLGTNGHAHDGTSIVNRWLERGLAKPGRVICVAAGNAGQEAPTGPDDMGFLQGRIHSSGQIPASGLSKDLEWVVIGDGKGDLSENELEIWYSMQDRFAIEVRPPNGTRWLGPIEPGEFIENQVLRDGTVVSIYNELYAPSNGHNHISLFLSPFMSKDNPIGVRPGVWTVRLHGREVRDGKYNAWIERDDPRRVGRLEFKTGWAFPSFFSKVTAVDNSTVNSLAAGHDIISVANFDEHSETIHVTSSQGPTRDGRSKPEIAAPGTGINAANGFDDRERLWVRMTGTSMASPYVTGVAGLMLSHDKELTAAQIAGIIRRSAKPLPSSDYAWKNDAGFGVIDPDQCLREASKINERKDRTR